MEILFVCTRNICRSPHAERLTTAYAARVSALGLRASSAGTCAVRGPARHPDSALALKQLSGVASDHNARQVAARNTSSADLILTMTMEHRNNVLEFSPRQLNRTFTLHDAARMAAGSEARIIDDRATLRSQISASELPEVDDPIGHGAGVHTGLANALAALLTPILRLWRNDQEGS